MMKKHTQVQKLDQLNLPVNNLNFVCKMNPYIL